MDKKHLTKLALMGLLVASTEAVATPENAAQFSQAPILLAKCGGGCSGVTAMENTPTYRQGGCNGSNYNYPRQSGCNGANRGARSGSCGGVTAMETMPTYKQGCSASGSCGGQPRPATTNPASTPQATQQRNIQNNSYNTNHNDQSNQMQYYSNQPADANQYNYNADAYNPNRNAAPRSNTTGSTYTTPNRTTPQNTPSYADTYQPTSTRNYPSTSTVPASNRTKPGYTAEADKPASDYNYMDIQVTTQNPSRLTEADLLNKLNSDGKKLYWSLDPQGRALAIDLASQNSYPDKNAAIKEAAQRTQKVKTDASKY